MKERICLVEDDPTIRELVAARLRQAGFQVDIFDAAESVCDSHSPWDLFVLDIMLADEMSGLELCQQLRQQDPLVPILILSALSESSDRIEGLKVGADDYLTKPFEMEELLLRIRGMLKRRPWYKILPENADTFRWGVNSLNFLTLEGSHKKQQFHLSQKECMIMKLLIENEGKVISRDEILDKVWGYSVFPSTRTVDNFILRLRKRFEETPNTPKNIHSVRGLGYKFTRSQDETIIT